MLDERITATTISTLNNEWTSVDRMHAMTMMKIRAVTTFIIAQVVLAREHTSRRSVDIAHAAD